MCGVAIEAVSWNHTNVGTLNLKLLGCSGMMAVETGMCGLVRRLLIGCLLLLSARLYFCSSERKSRGVRIISQLIPTLLMSHHSLPQPLIFRRVDYFSLCPLFLVTNTMFPLLLLLFRIGQHYHLFPTGIEHGTERKRDGTLTAKFPGDGVALFLSPWQKAELNPLCSLLKTLGAKKKKKCKEH